MLPGTTLTRHVMYHVTVAAPQSGLVAASRRETVTRRVKDKFLFLRSRDYNNARSGDNIFPRAGTPWVLPLDGASSGSVQANRIVCRRTRVRTNTALVI